MSADTTLGRHENTPSATGDTPPVPASLRVWPAIVVLALFWMFQYANRTLELSMFARFMSQLVVYGIVLLWFLVWWLTRRAIRWRERLLAMGMVLLAGVGTWLVADPSFKAFGIFMSTFPFVVTAWIAWLAVARRMSPAVQRAGFCLAILAIFGYFALQRFEGLDASLMADMNWRWRPTKEQEYLASRDITKESAPAKAAAAAGAWTPQPGDCLEYRGSQRNGAVPGVELAANWGEQPPKLLWRQRVGPSWSGLIVVDGHVVTQEQRGDVEAVVCYDAATGAEVWAHVDPVRFTEELSGPGPRGTPTFADGRIYTLGAKGRLNCLAADTGAVVWSHDIGADAGVTPAEMPMWGYSISPLAVDGLAVVFAGGTQDKSILAYRADDGTLAWSCAGGKQTYSSPQVLTLDGRKQIVMHDNGAIRGINIADGSALWEHPNGSEMSIPMLQPHLADAGDVVVAIEPGAALLEVTHDGDKWAVAPRWTSNALRPGFNDFVIHKGCIYGLSDGILCCLDLETGKRLWKKGRLGYGQIMLLPDQDQLLISSDKGEIILVSVDREGYKELGRFQAVEGKTWNGPVLAGGRLYLRNGEEMAAYELKPQGTPSQPVAVK
jgi:outer membrane protein assembly factor BamB